MSVVQSLLRAASRIERSPALGYACPTYSLLLVASDDALGSRIKSALRRARRCRFRVHRAARLADALHRIERGGADVIVLDTELADSTGLSTFQRIQDRAADIPVVVLATASDDRTAIRAVRAGATSFLMTCQFDAAALEQRVCAAIERQVGLSGLRRNAERLELALRATNDGVWDWDLRSDKVYYSARWSSMLGFPEVAVDGGPETWLDLVHPEDLPGLRSQLDAQRAEASRQFECEYRMLGAAGEYQWVLNRGLAVRDLGGTVCRMTGAQTDITARKHAEQQLIHDAFHDRLTGLANRALFMDRIGRALAFLHRNEGTQFALLYFDLDRFKEVNDSLGHAAGDALLVAIGNRMREALRPGDSVARLCGDEFAILVSNAHDAKAATHVAERVQELLRRPFGVCGRELLITASIGIALSASGYEGPEEMLHDADLAMYRAKSAGRAQFQVFDPEMHQSALALLRMESELRRAVEQRDFVMHYQPIVSLETGAIVGFEGMVRWNHPDRGLVLPAQFLAVAEESGLIVPIGWWVLHEACRQIKDWQDRFGCEPPLFVSVNISGRLFLEPEMVERVEAVLQEIGLESSSLRLEVTERAVLDHGDEAASMLAALRALGVAISIDDFGTGYSSLSHLQRLHYDAVKIDPSCVRKMEGEGQSAATVRTILSLAKTLGIGVIAEGVETAEQLSQLRQLRCPLGQGYWFTRPVTASVAEELIASAPSRWAPPG